VVPPRVEVRLADREVERLDDDVVEPRRVEQLLDPPRTPERERPRRAGRVGLHEPAPYEDLADLGQPRVVLGRRPRRQRHATARAQDAPRLAQRRLRVGEQHVAPPRQHRVHRRRRQVDPLRLHGPDLHVRGADLLRAGPGQLDHRFGAVRDDGLATGRHELRGHQAGVARAGR
jgi:hypothetical protein